MRRTISEQGVIAGNNIIFSFLPTDSTSIHSPGVPLNKELIWRGLKALYDVRQVIVRARAFRAHTGEQLMILAVFYHGCHRGNCWTISRWTVVYFVPVVQVSAVVGIVISDN